MAKFDVESFYDYCVALVQDNIAAKIAEINTEKGDSLLVAPTSGQYVEDFTEKIINQKFFIGFILTEAPVTSNNGQRYAAEPSMFIYAAFLDNDNEKARKKGLRYVRALAEIFQEDFHKKSEISAFEIIQHMPQSAQFQNTKEWYKIGGIEIKGTVVL